ncbi:unnamed protein product [Symbiodinium sp. CCMP2592]|nr:unnamed protein product [Symbiodinium sp. CCMP2592]
MIEAHSPKKPVNEPHNPEKPVKEPRNPEKPVKEPHNPEKPVKEPHNPEKPVKEPHNPEKPVNEAHNPEKPVNEARDEMPKDSVLKTHQFEGGGTDVSQASQRTSAPMPADTNRATLNRLPEPCDHDEHLPQTLMDYMFRQGVDTVGKMKDIDRAAQVIRWTRAIGQRDATFSCDQQHGYMAQVLHEFATKLKKQQAILQKATTDYEKYMQVILGLGDKKRAELDKSETDLKKLGAGLDKISSWVEGKLRERQGMVTSEQEKTMVVQLSFASALESILDAVNQECEDRLAAVDDSVTLDLESELQAMMLEAQGADEAAGHATPPRDPEGGKPLLAVKDKQSEPDTSLADLDHPKQTEPPAAVAEMDAREAKRLQHNARVTFDRRIKGADCPPQILEKIQSFQGQPSLMSEKTKEGFNDQLEAKRAEFDSLKGKMEALYSSCSNVQDKDLSTEQQADIATYLQQAETLSTDLVGSLRPMKMTLEPWIIPICIISQFLDHFTSSPQPM